MKKYEFTGEIMDYFGIKLNRIRRISDGLVGGWIEKEENLSHEDDCFVCDNVKVYGNATIRDNVIISDNAIICDNVIIYDNAIICDNALIYGNAEVYGNTQICDNAEVYDNAKVYGDAKVKDLDKILGEIQIPYKQIEFYQGNNTRMITAIKTLEDKWLFNVGCQKLITKEEFIDRIYNMKGGLEKNPHREFYLKILKMF